MVIVDPNGEGRKICKATSELIKEAKEKGVSPCDVCCQVKTPKNVPEQVVMHGRFGFTENGKT